MSELQGKRLRDVKFGNLPKGSEVPGTYWKYTHIDIGEKYPSNLTRTVWGYHSPEGGIGTLMQHTVRENDDRTISVVPNDGSSNSILHRSAKGDWHGYIYDGVWKPT